MSNHFQIMNLIVLEGSSLLAADHTQLLQVFIFASWSSTPVTMRVGWDPEQTPHCTVFLHAWLLIALAHLKVFFKSEKTRCLLLFLSASVPCNVLDVSHQPAQAGACWLSTSWGIMSQDCQFWSTTQNYFVLHPWMALCLSKRAQGSTEAEWFLLAKL